MTSLRSPSRLARLELQRLGGLPSTLKLLEARKSEVKETAALVLANCTHEDQEICAELVTVGLDPVVACLRPGENNAAVQLNAARTVANLTSMEATEPEGQPVSEVLRACNCTDLLFAILTSPRSGDLVLKPVSLALGNLACDDERVRDEAAKHGAMAPLARMLESSDADLREHALGALVNCTEGHAANSVALREHGAVPKLLPMIGAKVAGAGAGAAGSSPARGDLDEDTLDLALTLLTNIVSHDKTGCAEIHSGGGIDPLVALMESRVAEVQENATFLLAHCAEYGMKPAGSEDDSSGSGSSGKGDKASSSSSSSSSSSTSGSGEAKAGGGGRGGGSGSGSGPPPQMIGDSIRSQLRVASSGALTGLVWMVDHRSAFVRANAKRCLEGLRTGRGDTLVPFIEQGLVPLLHKKTGSKNKETAAYAGELLQWMKTEVQGPALHVLLRTLNLDGNEELRGNIAIALVHLCFEADHIRAAFINDGGLDSTLSMLLSPKGPGRGVCLEFLYAIQPLLQAQHAAEEKEQEEEAAAAAAEAQAAAGGGAAGGGGAVAGDPAGATAGTADAKDVDAKDDGGGYLARFNNPDDSDIQFILVNSSQPQADLQAAGSGANLVRAAQKRRSQQTLWTFYAHKEVLQDAKSGFFRDIFAQGAPGQSEFAIDDIEFPVFEALMRYLYSGSVASLLGNMVLPPPPGEDDDEGSLVTPRGREDGFDDDSGGLADGGQEERDRRERKKACRVLASVMRVSRRFGVPELQKFCSEHLRAQLCLDVLLAAFDAALSCHDVALGRACFSLAVDRFTDAASVPGGEADIQILVRTIRRFLVDALDDLCASY
eukprot:g1810.t1